MKVQVKEVTQRYPKDKLILEWARARQILQNSSRLAQLGKLEEEFFELSEAIDTKNEAEIKDALGDMYVVMTLVANMSNLTMAECVDHAYNEIKDRKGYLNEQGVFVKEV